jgi:cell division protein FtsZ
MGKAMMGTGEASGERRAIDAAEAAISNPLLDDVSMKGARGVLINITGGMDMTLFEVDEAANRIRDEVDPDANIIFGSTFDESLTGRMRVSVVATGIDAAVMAQPKPTVISLAASRPAARPIVQSAPRSEGAAALKTEAVATAQPAAVTAAAPQPVVAEATPAPATRTEPAFIAPRPAEPVQATAPQPQRAADPFAAAELANAAPRAEPVKRRGPSLFERVTGTGRARAQAQTAAAAPAAPATPAPAAQPRLGGLDPVDRASQPAQDDLLDIPAFLRRQAN